MFSLKILQRVLPIFWQSSGNKSLKLCFSSGIMQSFTPCYHFCTFHCTDSTPCTADCFRNFERRMGPVQSFTRRCNFIITQRCSVCSRGSCFIWRTETYHCFTCNQGGLVLGFMSTVDGLSNCIRIMSVTERNIPSACSKTHQLIVIDRKIG